MEWASTSSKSASLGQVFIRQIFLLKGMKFEFFMIFKRRSVSSGCPPTLVATWLFSCFVHFLISVCLHVEMPLWSLFVPRCVDKCVFLGLFARSSLWHGQTVFTGVCLFLCVRLCVGEAEQIKPVSSLIVFTVSSTQSVISTQTAICPNNQLKTTPVLLTFTAITAPIHR